MNMIMKKYLLIVIIGSFIFLQRSFAQNNQLLGMTNTCIFRINEDGAGFQVADLFNSIVIKLLP